MYLNSFEDKTQPQVKPEALAEKLPYSEIQATSMKPLKLLENITSSFFVGTEVSWPFEYKLVLTIGDMLLHICM